MMLFRNDLASHLFPGGWLYRELPEAAYNRGLNEVNLKDAPHPKSFVSQVLGLFHYRLMSVSFRFIDTPLRIQA